MPTPMEAAEPRLIAPAQVEVPPASKAPLLLMPELLRVRELVIV